MGAQALSSYLDATVAIFLHSGKPDRISRRAVEHIETHDLVITPMVTTDVRHHQPGSLGETDSLIVANAIAANEAP